MPGIRFEPPATLTDGQGVTVDARGGQFLTVITSPGYGVGVLTFADQPADGETVTIGAKVYTFESGALDAAYKVDIKGTLPLTIAALAAAIEANGIAGTDYGVGTEASTEVTAASDATTLTVTAVTRGATFAATVTLATDVTGASWDDTELTAPDAAVTTYSRVDSATATAHGELTATDTDDEIIVETIVVDWPYYRISVASGTARWALTTF